MININLIYLFQISALTNPLYEHQISSVEEAIDKIKNFGSYIGARYCYQDSDDPITQKIYRDFQECPVTLYCINRTAFKRDFFSLKNYRNILYMIPRLYVNNDGRKLLHLVSEYGVGIWIRMHTLKGLPFLERIDELLLYLRVRSTAKQFSN